MIAPLFTREVHARRRRKTLPEGLQSPMTRASSAAAVWKSDVPCAPASASPKTWLPSRALFACEGEYATSLRNTVHPSLVVAARTRCLASGSSRSKSVGWLKTTPATATRCWAWHRWNSSSNRPSRGDVQRRVVVWPHWNENEVAGKERRRHQERAIRGAVDRNSNRIGPEPSR